MKTSEVVKLLVDGIARHGDADLKVNGRDVSTLVFSDEENVPVMTEKPWFELIPE